MASITMADNNFKTPEGEQQQEENARIPVLTVIKNNTILKNIFIIFNDENEHTFLVGRNPRCNIVLTHPSISRFHLKIRSAPSSHTLSLVDLASVHGSWVCGKKLEPGVSMELKEGDTFALGVSTRVYRLCWVPLTREFDSEHPFVSQLGVVMPREGEDEEKMIKDVRPEENLEFSAAQETLIPEDIVTFCCDEERKSQSKDETFGVLNGSFAAETSCFPANSDGAKEPCGIQSLVLCPPYVQSIDEVDDTQKIEAYPEVEMPEETSLLCTLRKCLAQNICLPVVETVQGTKMQRFQGHTDTFTAQLPSSEIHSPSLLTGIDLASFDGKSAAAVDALPTESEFGCTPRDNHKIEDISTTGEIIFKCDGICSLVGEDIPNIDPVSFDDNAETTMDAVPKESEFGCTLRDHHKIKDISTTGEILFKSEDTCLLIGEDIPNIDPESFDENGEAAVDAVSKESEFGCTRRDNHKIEDVSTTGEIIFKSKDTCSLIGEDIPNIDPASSDENGEAAVNAAPKESEFGCTLRENRKIEDISTTGEIILKSEDMCLLTGEDIPKIHPESFDENGDATVDAVPKDSEFGCTLRGNHKTEDILATGEIIFKAEDTCSLIGGDIPDSKFHHIKFVEEVSADLLSDGEKRDECSEEHNSKLKDLNEKSIHEQGNSLDEIVEDIGNKCVKNIDPASFDENGTATLTIILKESEFGCSLKDNDRIEDIITTEAGVINSENTSLLEEEALLVNKFQQIKIVEKADKDGKKLKSKLLADMKDRSPNDIVEDSGNKSLNSSIPREAPFNITSKIENRSPQFPIAVSGRSDTKILESRVQPDDIVEDIEKKSLNSSIPQEAPLSMTSKIENRSPQFPIAVSGCSDIKILDSRVEPIEKSSIYGKVHSRPSKAASAPQVRARMSRLMNASNIGTEVKKRNVKDIINKSMPKNLCSIFYDEKEILVPNKENLSPNTLLFVRKKGKLEHSKSLSSHNSKANFSSNIFSAESICAISTKENKSPKAAQEWKSRRKPLECHMKMAHEQDTMELKNNRVKKVPFQSLMNSRSNHKSGTSGPVSASKRSDDARHCGQISDKHTKPSHVSEEQKRKWVMVVDTASLLNKDSRKALQLLQGLKGTRLVIPILVIRELENMKQQYRIFQRTSEASLALEWIEECTQNSKSWIYIQSSKELASPTVEDHILDCALAYRTKENIGQLVLLSDDITLKVKSMAKGLICETVQKFRHSLVNPFSERFMWPNSSPRGLTWSCQDDVVLRKKYCGLPSKAGLKLIT